MILDDLTIHDFGVYGGRQSIELTPRASDRPIVLFGGLNGGGKTTLVDAMQLCLYGQAAKCSNRNGLAYEEFLRRSVHRGAEAPEAAVALSFRHTTAGVEHSFRLHRSWSVTNGGAREKFDVLRDGKPDRLATEYWAEQVEDFMPHRIAHLFLFDGEKVEGYADPEGASGLIATAIQNLLGLDIVERLSTDLMVLERRKRVEAKPSREREAIDALADGIARLEEGRVQLVVARATAASVIDRRRSELAAIEERYRREGGNLSERRATAEAEAAENERRLESAAKELRDLATGPAPFFLVAPLLQSMVDRDGGETAVRRSAETLAELEEEHREIAAMPELASLTPDALAALRRGLDARLAARRTVVSVPRLLDLGADARLGLAALLGSELPVLETRLLEALAVHRGERRGLDDAQAALAATPNPDAVAQLAETRAAARAELARLEAEQKHRSSEIERLVRELERAREKEARLAEAGARERLEREDIERIVVHSAKVRITLGRFREAVVDRHVTRIQAYVLDSFHRLVRKRSLVSDLRIDPRTFALELRGGDGRPLTPDRLSAGERQLLATAILWGLGRASGRPLPTVIDTPLGRLDSEHRTHLVRRYFPHASHQVLLLSTDEEIAGQYYEDLKPSVDRAYRLRFDEAAGRTIIESGYLEGAALAH